MQQARAFIMVGVTVLLVLLIASACSSAETEEPEAAGSQVSTEPAGSTEAVAAAAVDIAASRYLFQQEVPMNMELKSPAFSDGRRISMKYTCNGEGISPALKWSGAPEGTLSFALISDDTPEINGSVVHWLVYSIPPDVTELEKGIPSGDLLSNGAKQGNTAFPLQGYSGPCPKQGDSPVNQYFKIYALDMEVGLPGGSTRDELMQLVDGHILAGGILSGMALPGTAPKMTY